ncbi:DEFICIENS-like MADS-box transcription factor [Carex littledalei]|uniref:DEFICIENS-like MADS-box transcription factor n=1 Tax=Carex littledalei TaxID=544730 RepID=A0A833RAR6_9POAL|nr:DEFICIENS-like MADS-box transcription factor [Carex littledalei]
MGRGKIEIKKIENTTSRQVTYSKRRSGILKKARELTVLCDAQIAIIMFSNTNKHYEYCSPSTDIKGMYDRYQQVTQTDLWSTQYEKMQNTLRQLKQVNDDLRKQIRQRTGADVEELDMDKLRDLEADLDQSLTTVRNRKFSYIQTQTDTYKKKVKSSQEQYNTLAHNLVALEMKEDHPIYGYVDNNPGNYENTLAMANGGAHMYGYRVLPSQPNLHDMGFGMHDLRLA